MTAIWVLSDAMNIENFFKSMNSVSQKAAGFSSFALSLLLGAWCLTGFEAAADLAEETKSPRKHVPRAVISSQLSATLAGFFIIILLVLSAGNIGKTQGNNNALISILENSIGKRATAATGIVVMQSIFACAGASMATATRLLFSMSRDNIFPFSSFLAKVNLKRQTPQVATLGIWRKIVHGAVLPLAWGWISDNWSAKNAYWIVIPSYLIIFFYAIYGYKIKTWKKADNQ